MLEGMVPREIREGPEAIRATVATAREQARTVAAGWRRAGIRRVLPLPVGTAEEHAPLSAVPPVALLAFALARVREANPDHPGWIERYHSQGLTHILVGGGEASS